MLSSELQAKKKLQEEIKDLQNYVFATHKKLKLGPGQYDCKYS